MIQDILECEVKWALESITTNKASGGDGIPVELFQILKDDCTQYASKFGKFSSGHRTGKGANINNAEKINTEELYKKDLHDKDNHDGVITHLEPDILECEVKWALGSITTHKASGDNGTPVSYFKF